jgi:hypothetical protein
MPGYIERALQRFVHPKPARKQHSQHAWKAPVYGSRQQYEQHDNSPALDLKDTKHVQEVLGTLLYYGRAVDCNCTIVISIGSITTQQAKATKLTLDSIVQLLDYWATHPNAIVRFRKSDMILYVESDASYLCEAKARSRAAGYHYLSSTPPNPDKLADAPAPPLNGPINVLCKILCKILSSAVEAELAGLYLNGKEAVPERITLEELGHPQPPTPMVTDNSTASGIANDSVNQHRSKAMDMRFYWIRDRVRQGQFLHVYWKKAKQTGQIIFPNITLPSTIDTSAPSTSTNRSPTTTPPLMRRRRTHH